MTAKPIRESILDESDRKVAAWDAWRLFMGAARLASLPDKQLTDAWRDMRRARDMLTARLKVMK